MGRKFLPKAFGSRKTIPLPEDIYALDIEKIGDFLFVYAESANGHKLYMIDERTPEVYWIVAAVPFRDIEGLYASEGDLYIRSCNGADKKIQLATEDISKEQWPVKNSAPVYISDENTNVFWKKESAGEQVSGEEEKGTLNLTCRLDPLGAFYLGKMGNVEYAVTNETDWSYAETRVTKFVDGENTESALTISGKEYFFGFPFKKIYIQNDIVYQMVPVENGIEIYQIPWSSSIQTRFSEEMVEEFREEELQEELFEKELQEEEFQGEEHDPTLPDSVDYQNLTEEQKALLEENEKNALTEEKIAQMSVRELWEYQLIPLEGVGDGVFSSYPVSYYGMPELYPFQTEGVPYYGRCSSQHYVIGYELYQEPEAAGGSESGTGNLSDGGNRGTRRGLIAVLENPAQAGQRNAIMKIMWF